MRYIWIDEYLLSNLLTVPKTGVTKDHKQEWNWIRYQIRGYKMTHFNMDKYSVC